MSLSEVLDVSRELLAQGLSASALVVRGVDNSRISPELLAYRRQVAQQLGAYWKNRSISAHPVISEYHRAHLEFGVEREVPSPEKLITYVRRNRDFTSAGAVVDCYNIVSAKTLLSIGAHQLDRLALPISFRRCVESDVFVPLGEPGQRRDVAGEYGYVDRADQVICRLEVLQGHGSKVDVDSTDIVLLLQANSAHGSGDLLAGTWLLAEMIERFCGGNAELVAFTTPDAVR